MDTTHHVTNLTVPNEVTQHLDDHEETLWVGRPRQGVVFRIIDIVLIPFSILACYLFSRWAYLIWTDPEIIVPKLALVPAFGFCFYLLFGRFLLDIRRRARTYYVITSERSLIISGPKSLVVASFWHRSRQFEPFNTRTITFGNPNGLGHMYVRAMGIDQNNLTEPEFEDCPDNATARTILQRVWVAVSFEPLATRI